MRARSCACRLPPPRLLSGALSARPIEQFLDELRRLHFVEILDAGTEKLLSHFLDVLFTQVALVDQAEDESLLAIGAIPTVAVVGRSGMIFVAVPVSVSAAVAVSVVHP